jgi:ORF6N domain
MIGRELTTLERIEDRILSIRGTRVLLDADLAFLYGVPTRSLNQAVKRNQKRFPRDFVFQITPEEKKEVITNCDNLKYVKYYRGLSFAFTEHGAVMAANVLKSEQAIETSVFVVRAFVRLRHMLSSHADLSRRLDELEQRYDGHFKVVFDALRELMKPPQLPAKRRIGFALERPHD